MSAAKRRQVAVFGIFESRLALENAIDNLRMAGFRSSDLSILAPDGDSNPKFAHEKASKAPEGALVGAVFGVLIGALIGAMIGSGRLLMPGFASMFAAGPLIAGFAGAGAIGILFGLIGALMGSGIPEYEAKRYETAVERGGLLMSVHADDTNWEAKAKGILRCCGAKDIGSQPEVRSDVFTTDFIEEQEYTAFNVL